MSDHRLVRTTRLVLEAAAPEDHLDALYPIFADPRTWEHAPEGRHAAPARTEAWLVRADHRWRAGGLGYWAVRLAHTGAVVGAGGCEREGAAWNLFYRLDPAAWGHGYATELGEAALAAAHAVDPEAPVVAWILAHNPASRRTAVRLGLIEHAPRIDPKDGVERVPYADRRL